MMGAVPDEVPVDKVKVKYGVVRIAESSGAFFIQTFGRMFWIMALLAGIVLLIGVIASNGQWLDRRLQLLAFSTGNHVVRLWVVEAIAAITSISFTQWLLIVLVLIVGNNNIVARRILEKLKDGESAVQKRNAED